MNLLYKLAFIAAVGCVWLGVSLAEAGTVFLDDFEDDTLGSVPVISGSNTGGSYGTPLNTVSAGANPEVNGNTSDQVLVGAGDATFANNIVAHFAGGAQPIGGLAISYDFYASAAAGHDNDGVRVALVGNADGNRDVFIRNDRDTAILIDGATLAEVNYGAEVWQNFTGLFTATDASAGHYDLAWRITNLEDSTSVGGTQAVTINTANFTDGKARGVLLEAFEGNAPNNDFTGYIDNVSVTAVPEPAAATLAGLCGLALFVLRGRRPRDDW